MMMIYGRYDKAGKGWFHYTERSLELMASDKGRGKTIIGGDGWLDTPPSIGASASAMLDRVYLHINEAKNKPPSYARNLENDIFVLPIDKRSPELLELALLVIPPYDKKGVCEMVTEMLELEDVS